MIKKISLTLLALIFVFSTVGVSLALENLRDCLFQAGLILWRPPMYSRLPIWWRLKKKPWPAPSATTDRTAAWPIWAVSICPVAIGVNGSTF